MARELDAHGCALLPRLLTPAECARIAGLYDQPGHFRATIDMARHRFGEASTATSPAPFPEPVDALRHGLLRAAAAGRPRLVRAAPAAAPEWPDTLDEWLDSLPRRRADEADRRSCCATRRAAGTRCTATCTGTRCSRCRSWSTSATRAPTTPAASSCSGRAAARAQSRGTATLIPQGHGLVFTTRDRPVASARGWSAAPVRHGVSTIRSGRRYTLGLVFHDAA